MYSSGNWSLLRLLTIFIEDSLIELQFLDKVTLLTQSFLYDRGIILSFYILISKAHFCCIIQHDFDMVLNLEMPDSNALIIVPKLRFSLHLLPTFYYKCSGTEKPEIYFRWRYPLCIKAPYANASITNRTLYWCLKSQVLIATVKSKC